MFTSRVGGIKMRHAKSSSLDIGVTIVSYDGVGYRSNSSTLTVFSWSS